MIPTRTALQWWARLGYGARGVLYLIIGGLALLAALDSGGKNAGARGALQQISEMPLEDILQGAMALGLFGYAAWRFIQSVFDADNHGANAKALLIRMGLLISSVTHAGLGLFALGLALSFDSGGASRGWLVQLFEQPGGRWLVIAVGAGIFGAGVAHANKAVHRKYLQHFKMDRQMMSKLEPIIRFGLMARAVIFMIVAFLIVVTAWRYDPQQSLGLKDALDYLQGRPFGALLLGVTAAGLFAFGVYSVLESIYRRIDPS